MPEITGAPKMALPSVGKRSTASPLSRDMKCSMPSASPNTTALPTIKGALKPRCISLSEVHNTSPVAAFQAVMRSEASAPKTVCSSAATPSVPPPARVHFKVPSCASTQPTAAWKDRAQTMSPTLDAGATKSAKRSTSLVPRGEATATSNLTLPSRGSRPTKRAPWPTSSVSLKAAITPACAKVNGSLGR